MAVAVIELVVWILLGLETAGCSKVLAPALFLCLAYEDTGPEHDGSIGLVPSSNIYNNNRLGTSS
jgi:hypothetical protein